MTSATTLFKTEDPITSTIISLIEAKTGMLTEYHVILREKKKAPEIRVHSMIDTAIRDYLSTVTSEVSTLGSQELQAAYEDHPAFENDDGIFGETEEVHLFADIESPVSPPFLYANEDMRQ